MKVTQYTRKRFNLVNRSLSNQFLDSFPTANLLTNDPRELKPQDGFQIAIELRGVCYVGIYRAKAEGLVCLAAKPEASTRK